MSTEALGQNPLNHAEDVTMQPAAAIEKSYREKGKENRAAFNKKIENAKATVSGWMKKFGGWASDKKESAIDHAFAVPGMAADAHEAVSSKIDNAEEKFVQSAEAVGRGAEWAAAYAKYKTVEGAKAVDKGLVDLQEKAHKKIYEFSDAALNMKQKIEVGTQNEIDAWKNAGVEFGKDMVELKNDIKGGAEKLAIIGVGATMVAGEKIKSGWNKFTDRITKWRIESAQKKLDEKRADHIEALKKLNDLTKKAELKNSLFAKDSQAVAA